MKPARVFPLLLDWAKREDNTSRPICVSLEGSPPQISRAPFFRERTGNRLGTTSRTSCAIEGVDMFFGSKIPRTFAVGDVHGCAAELEALLERLQPKEDDTFVFLGDYVDRGPSARRVIDLIIALSERCEVICLKGNHEAMFLDFLEHPESAGAGLFILNGGAATLASYETEGGAFEIPESHLHFLQKLKLWHQTDTHFFVHAGVPLQPLASLSETEHEQLCLWSRQPFLSTSYKWEKIVVHGHTPAPEPERKANRINVDTGCVYGGRLTALELPAGKFHEVARGTKVTPSLFPIDRARSTASARIALRFSGRLPVEASRDGEAKMAFETLNFNQFGLLMAETMQSKASLQAKGAAEPRLAMGDVIEGRIGDGEAAIMFQGEVVRIESRGEFAHYGVRIDRISNGNGGREWITRPAAPSGSKA